VQEETDRVKCTRIECQGQLIPDVMPMSGRISPFVFLFSLPLVSRGLFEPVQVKRDCGCIDEERMQTMSSSPFAVGIEDGRDQRYELRIIESAQSSIDRIGRGNLVDVHEFSQFSPVFQFLDYKRTFDWEEHRHNGDLYCLDDCLNRCNLVFCKFLQCAASRYQCQDLSQEKPFWVLPFY